ncbi:MAG: cysteate synthase [Desulfobacteraceae bacterium]|nr:cysteate synthase [Desulfobacteraceae bacterium]
MNTEYILKCLSCNSTFNDDGWIISCGHEHTASLLRTEYSKKKLGLKSDRHGLYKYADWLPVNRFLEESTAPMTYKSKNLAKVLGLSNLYIVFNGYWPEIQANMTTGTFKECEAYSACARILPDSGKTLVVASAGNSARAFAKVCSDNEIPLLLAVPETNLSSLWFEKKLNPCVKLVAVGKGCDYTDAIHLMELVCQMEEFFPGGGTKNIARRDGIGTSVLSATSTIGAIPDYYFQAVGSGAGAIAAWEANLRLMESNEYGRKKMKLMLSQNAPFLLLYDSWKQRSRELVRRDETILKEQIRHIHARVLSNRHPPYSITGGLYDALDDLGGKIFSISNEEAIAAGALFKTAEGEDICPEASVAVAALKKASVNGYMEKDAIVVLNITGGGMERFRTENPVSYPKPCTVFQKNDFDLNTIHKKLR